MHYSQITVDTAHTSVSNEHIMKNNYQNGNRTARIEKVIGSQWYKVNYTEHNGIMVYSRSFPYRADAVSFAKAWVAA